MEDNESPRIHLVSERASRKIEEDYVLDQANHIAIEFASNLLRVIRGAGKPYSIVHDTTSMVAAIERCRKTSGFYPGDNVSSNMNDILWRSQQYSEEKDAIDRILRGALQVVASRLFKQSTQERNGLSELREGIRDYVKWQKSYPLC